MDEHPGHRISRAVQLYVDRIAGNPRQDAAVAILTGLGKYSALGASVIDRVVGDSDPHIAAASIEDGDAVGS